MAERTQEFEALATEHKGLVTAHRATFPAAARQVAEAPGEIDRDEILREVELDTEVGELRDELEPFGSPPAAPPVAPVDPEVIIREQRATDLRGVPLLRFGERRRVKKEADRKSAVRIEEERQRRQEARTKQQEELEAKAERLRELESEVAAEVERLTTRERDRFDALARSQQEDLDREWGQLQSNDPETVMAALEQAFADNDAPAAPFDCQGAGVSVVINFVGVESIAERKPAFTPGGKPTTKKQTKTERNELYLAALGSTVLATAKEAFATAPAIERVTIVVIREEEPLDEMAPIYAGRFDRGDSSAFATDDPDIELIHAEDALIEFKGRANEVMPLDLESEPELTKMVEQLVESWESEVEPG